VDTQEHEQGQSLSVPVEMPLEVVAVSPSVLLFIPRQHDTLFLVPPLVSTSVTSITVDEPDGRRYGTNCTLCASDKLIVVAVII
jgi:hypothetical protein